MRHRQNFRWGALATTWRISLSRVLAAFVVLVTLGLAPCPLTAAGSTAGAWASHPQGWTDIMPQPDLKGWYRVPVPPTGRLGRAQWHVDAPRHVLICDGDGGHEMLLTRKEYGDVIFHFEFRYLKTAGKPHYNSGAYVRNSGDGSIWHQAQFGGGTGGFLFGETLAADGHKFRFNLAKKLTDHRVRPAGEWNVMELTAQGRVLTLWVNGSVTCRFDDCHVPKGHLGVEAEGYRIEFRNLKVKPLNPSGEAAP